MITVMKASAGSGKTYALAQNYINMLLRSDDPKEYRHILAVTFTNKATDEMKSRIIEELAKHKDPKAQRILSDILHDYSAFAVSTIDKFFQQTLRAFARELGQFGRYQVELDKNALVDETVDTILNELDVSKAEDRQMVDFIVEHMEERLADGKTLNVDDGLKSMARQLKSESFGKKAKEIELDREKAYGREELSKLKDSCHRAMKGFEESVHALANEIIAANTGAGFDFQSYNRGWLKFIEKYSTMRAGELEPPSEANMKKILDPSAETWFAKAKQGLFPRAYEAVGEKLERFAQLWTGDAFREFHTAQMLLPQVYGLGVAARLFRTFDRVVKEKNVVCPDESNSLLRDIIDGSDAPFVYEKTGVRFKTFLLDEFQDTSSTQWENFLPLLKESEANKDPEAKDHVFDNLIVGDVKQSIYRWRESDWGLLDHQVEASFPGHIHNDPLGCNWRSLKEIVDFNNELYPYIAASVDSQNPVPEGMNSVSSIYAGCHQELGKPDEQQGGSVDINFVSGEFVQLHRVWEMIDNLVKNHGARYSDIAIMVRKKAPGTLIAQHLIGLGVPVVTDASLRLKNSLSVRRLVAMMGYVDNPKDSVSAYIAQQYNISREHASYHSLPDLVEGLYRDLCSDEQLRLNCEDEVMYITSFMDFVMDYSNNTGNNLHEFLQYWKEKDPVVNSASGSDAVRIITIHKSKGLAFPFVIVPFLETISLYDSMKTSVWAAPEHSRGPLKDFSARLYYVPLTAKMAGNSFFRDAFQMERFNQGVDAVNLLYVATTRAQKGMLLTADTSSRSYGGSIAKLLYEFCGKNDLHRGEYADFSADRSQDGQDAEVGTVMLSYPFYNIGKRLAIRPYAADFFTEADNSYEGLDYRTRGIVLHDILSRVFRASDLEASVDTAIAEGALSAESKDRVMKFLGRRIASHPEFFPSAESGVKVLAETELIDGDGTSHRPDRIIFHPDGKVVVVDYKFGRPKEEYNAQIEGYRRILGEMGYKHVFAHLWFVYQNII
ncbi:MAG: UvrD-helicase domain-containing protein [Bacteroidales bacterium]|nr:UvrD-helicase domain-containing protein [Bacteroidales bacterium]